MHAAVLAAPRQFAIADRPAPVAGAGDVVVRVAATAICHTDLGIYTGEHPGVHYPVIMGHEATGRVESLGGGEEKVPEEREDAGDEPDAGVASGRLG